LRLSVACAIAARAPGARWCTAQTLERTDLRDLYGQISIAPAPALTASAQEERRDSRTGQVHDALGRAVIHAGGALFEPNVDALDGGAAPPTGLGSGGRKRPFWAAQGWSMRLPRFRQTTVSPRCSTPSGVG
jgi:hypothetical protein